MLGVRVPVKGEMSVAKILENFEVGPYVAFVALPDVLCRGK